MNGPIRRLAIGAFLAIGLLLAATTWHQVVQADQLRSHPLNPRPALAERGKERGLIVARDGTVLARSVEDPDDPLAFIRTYPEGPLFAHVVGYSSFLVGNHALEAAYSSDLRSRRDLAISDLVSVILGRDLRPKSIEVTVVPELQRAALEALGENRGAVVAIEPGTGAILALVSTPSYDPSVLVGDGQAEGWEELLAAPGEPLRDRATRELYAPGSTFKAVVTAAALDTGAAEPGTEFSDPVSLALPGSSATISNFDGGTCAGGGTVTLLQAFVRSCNTTFGALAMDLGASEIGVTADALGFNGRPEFPWQVAESSFPAGELADDLPALAQSGIGERDVRATPLQMAMVAAAVANNGVTPQPHLVSQVFDGDGNTVERTEPGDLGRAMAPETAATLARMMERVVTEGTGKRAAVPGLRVAGKTGTAAGTGGFPDSWFIGFAPADEPRIAVAALVEGSPIAGETATGGGVAAPVAAAVIEAWRGLGP